MIEVAHNPDQLIAKRTIKVSDVQHAMTFIRKFMTVKQPRGLRVRYQENYQTKKIECSARSSWALQTFISALRRAGLVRR